MKKLLLASLLAFGMTSMSYATSVTLNISEATDKQGTETTSGIQPLESFKLGDYTFTFESEGQTKPAYWNNDNTLRMYVGTTMTITGGNIADIKKVVLTGKNIKGISDTGLPTATGYTASFDATDSNAKTITFVGSNTGSFVMQVYGEKVDNVNPNYQISSITLSTDGEGGGETPVDPTPGPGDDPEPDTNIILESDFATSNSGFTFEDGTLPEGLTYVWTRNTKNDYFYMKASGYYKQAYEVEGAYLVSPVMDLTSRNEIELTFRHTYGFVNSLDDVKDKYSVWVREENMDWSVELPIQAWPEWGGAYTKFGQWTDAGTFDLDQFKDKKIQIGWKYTSTAESAGTWEIDAVKVTGKLDNAISNIEADVNAPVEYFNLQGVRVANPENGLYIMRQGNKVTKVIR